MPILHFWDTELGTGFWRVVWLWLFWRAGTGNSELRIGKADDGGDSGAGMATWSVPASADVKIKKFWNVASTGGCAFWGLGGNGSNPNALGGIKIFSGKRGVGEFLSLQVGRGETIKQAGVCAS